MQQPFHLHRLVMGIFFLVDLTQRNKFCHSRISQSVSVSVPIPKVRHTMQSEIHVKQRRKGEELNVHFMKVHFSPINFKMGCRPHK